MNKLIKSSGILNYFKAISKQPDTSDAQLDYHDYKENIYSNNNYAKSRDSYSKRVHALNEYDKYKPKATIHRFVNDAVHGNDHGGEVEYTDQTIPEMLNIRGLKEKSAFERGFIKRASAYGLTYSEAEAIFKNAVFFGNLRSSDKDKDKNKNPYDWDNVSEDKKRELRLTVAETFGKIKRPDDLSSN